MSSTTTRPSCPLVAFVRQHTLDRDDESFDDDYTEMQRLLRLEFGECPFTICLDREDLLRLDEPLTDRPHIVVHDGRAHAPSGFPMDDPRRDRLTTDTIVTAVDNEPITLRRILHTIKHVPEYAEIAQLSDRVFLQDIGQCTPSRFSCYFGS